jgi:hypothetical protein
MKGSCISPTKYVEIPCDLKGSARKHSLIEILKIAGFTDRYHAALGNQPEGAVDFPPEIEPEIKAQIKAE